MPLNDQDTFSRAYRELVAERDHLAQAYNDACRAQTDHCKDCCCARSWKALGVTEYTGLSIPEHIERLRTALDEADDLLCCAEASQDLEGASAEDWDAQMDAWRTRNGFGGEQP